MTLAVGSLMWSRLASKRCYTLLHHLRPTAQPRLPLPSLLPVYYCKYTQPIRSLSDDTSGKPQAEEVVTIDEELVKKLERLSLLEFEPEAAMSRLRRIIKSVDPLLSVDTTGVEPMISVQEYRAQSLRPDAVTEGNDKEAVLKNAAKIFEDYYVAPPGNIPLKRTRD
ncbi:glutamyl-tRNA(Gln) amidotransferase subunit C, mitochondrial-like [Argonauta hians]